ncbi:macro domain-containing protein [Saccharothrix carnea]|uniref:Macro domain-containing protein n=2 Tax=Saccharothrix carnea TaxID=1280637 RepID=A0A2P8HGE0_SACCR|nr:macro domain-containing protein [Saccharothrix carnea]
MTISPRTRRDVVVVDPDRLLAAARAAYRELDPGLTDAALATPAFDLTPPVRHVIHTVGPVWEGGGHGEAEVLASCYRRSLEVTADLRARTVAFPAIATGVYGFPPEEAARIAITTIRATPTDLTLVRPVAFDEDTEIPLDAEPARTDNP